jgi:NADPH-dependent ferric siderophore reductase
VTRADPYASSNIPYGVIGLAEVVKAELVAPRLRRITLAGDRFRELGRLNPQNCTARLFFPFTIGEEPMLPSFDEDPERVLQQLTTYVGRIGEVIRTWTMRRLDLSADEVDLDFVLREGRGLGLEWGKQAERGDRVGFLLTQNATSPGADFDRHFLLGDETALSHIAVILACLPAGARATVVGEVVDEADEQVFESDAEVDVTWVHRGDAPAGTTHLLEEALRDLGKPSGHFFVQAFAEARIIGELRRFLREVWEVDRGNYAVGGFWRRGRTLTNQARLGYARIEAMAAEGKTVDEEEFSKFLEFD